MPINASVGPVCVVSAVPLNFGAYDPVVTNQSTPLDQQATITVQCLRGSAYTVKLNPGAHPAAGLRYMAGPAAAMMHYELYSDSSRTTVWDNTNFVSGSATDTTPIPITVYGRIFPGQDVVAGAYTDTVTVTVEF